MSAPRSVQDLPPLGLYVHLPYCVRKCPYCDFNSYTATDRTSRSDYIAALLADIRAEAALAGDRPLQSVFLGGGTPSYFAASQIGEVLDVVSRHFRLADDIEITMEANPGTVESGAPRGYREAGVNRLSIGAQSFNAGMLARLGRIHSVDDIARSFHEAREAGFDNINLDVMWGLPGQQAAEAVEDLEAAIALGPEHISWYQLTLEPNTVFYARPPAAMPDDDTAWEMQQQGQARLAGNGFEQYEVSAYARDGRRCAHNLNYWRFGDYLAAGAGAHGKITLDAGPARYRKPDNPQAFMQRPPAARTASPTAVPPAERVFEFALMTTRLKEGFTERQFEHCTLLPAATLREALAAPVARGLVAADPGGRYRPTELGWRFLNELQAQFLD